MLENTRGINAKPNSSGLGFEDVTLIRRGFHGKIAAILNATASGFGSRAFAGFWSAAVILKWKARKNPRGKCIFRGIGSRVWRPMKCVQNGNLGTSPAWKYFLGSPRRAGAAAQGRNPVYSLAGGVHRSVIVWTVPVKDFQRTCAWGFACLFHWLGQQRAAFFGVGALRLCCRLWSRALSGRSPRGQPLQPTSPYGWNKKMLRISANVGNRRPVVLGFCLRRIFSAYGPGLRKQLFWTSPKS